MMRSVSVKHTLLLVMLIAPLISSCSKKLGADSSAREDTGFSNDCEEASKRITMLETKLFCIDAYYGFRTEAKEKFLKLMYNNQLTSINAYASAGQCTLAISASGIVYGESFSDKVTCDITPYMNEILGKK